MNLARIATRSPKLVIIAFLVVTAVAAIGLRQLKQTDNVLDFIPPEDPDVKVFNHVNEHFPVLRVVMIGVEAPPGDDVFSRSVIERIEAATQAIKQVPGVDDVLSLTSVKDFETSESGANTRQLVEGPPTTAEARAALKQRVMAKDHIVGSIVSKDATATRIMVFLAAPKDAKEGLQVRVLANDIRRASDGALGGLKAVYGGMPFAAAAIFEETQADIRNLTPFAALLILLVILISFRDPVGVVLTIVTVAWSLLVVAGAMGFLREPFTVASGTLPVILFASGSSYAIHLLGRYYALVSQEKAQGHNDGAEGAAPGAPAMIRAAEIVGPPVAIAGLTTSAGFFSFLVMDIRPMRAFGLECALGVLLCYVAALLLVPAVITLWPRRGSAPATMGKVGLGLAAMGRFARRYRVVLLLLCVGAGVATVRPMLDVEVRMDPSAFFRPGSEPWRVDRFLDDKFGGSRFLFIAVTGDIADPATLREIDRLATFARAQPNVTQVQSIAWPPMKLVADVVGDGRHLPHTKAQAQTLMFFAEMDPASLRMLMTPARDMALVHVSVRGDAAVAMATVEKYLETGFNRRPGPPARAQVAERIHWIGAARSIPLDAAIVDKVVALELPASTDPELVAARHDAALKVLAGEGSGVPLVDDIASRQRIANEVAQMADAKGAAHAQLIAASPSPEEGESAWSTLVERLGSVGRELAADRAVAPLAGRLDLAARTEVKDLVLDLLPGVPILTAEKPLEVEMTGQPVLDRGMSRSVAKNQTRSLIVSLIAVLILMGLLFRSATMALLSVFPSALTMAVVFGVMGLMGVRIDIGTSLVASIATGAGSDFAMHYLWYLRRSSAADVTRFVGPIMVVSSLLVAAGFAILGLGKSQPMRMFGTLAAIAMALAALLTFLIVPALVGKVSAAPAPPQPAAEANGGE